MQHSVQSRLRRMAEKPGADYRLAGSIEPTISSDGVNLDLPSFTRNPAALRNARPKNHTHAKNKKKAA